VTRRADGAAGGEHAVVDASRRIVEIVRAIPRGRVASYGQVAAMAGLPNGARQVARLLHAASRTRRLPWHRVINAAGGVSLAPGAGGDLQRVLLAREGVTFVRGRVDLRRHGWRPVLPG
jgi:methylated-DNA-protein-cysteine methyltransferase-like protein